MASHHFECKVLLWCTALAQKGSTRLRRWWTYWWKLAHLHGRHKLRLHKAAVYPDGSHPLMATWAGFIGYRGMPGQIDRASPNNDSHPRQQWRPELLVSVLKRHRPSSEARYISYLPFTVTQTSLAAITCTNHLPICIKIRSHPITNEGEVGVMAQPL
jgi:hypothetical protein